MICPLYIASSNPRLSPKIKLTQINVLRMIMKILPICDPTSLSDNVRCRRAKRGGNPLVALVGHRVGVLI
jgi:hypothetical protein